MAIWWLDPYIEAAVGGIHGTTDTATRNGSYAAPFAFSDVVATSDNGANTINGQVISEGDELRLKGLDYQSFLYNTSTIDNKLNVTYNNSTRFNVISTEHQTQWNNWLTAHDNMNYNHGVVMYYDPNLVGTHKWLFQNIDIDASNNLYGASSNVSYSLASGWHEGLQSSTGAWQISMFNPDYIIDRASTTGTEYYFQERQYNVTITDGWTSETVRDGVTFIVDENPSYGTKNWFTSDHSQSSPRDPYYKLDLPNTFIYTYIANNSSNSSQPILNINHTPTGETWRLGKFACPSASAWKYLRMYGDHYNSDLTDVERDTRTFEIGTLQVVNYLQVYANIGTTKINNWFGYTGPYIRSGVSFHSVVEFSNIIVYTQYSQNCLLYVTGTGPDGGFVRISDNALLSAVNGASYLVRPGYDAALLPSNNPDTILTSASASWPYPLGDAGNSPYNLPSSSGLLITDREIYGSVNNTAPPTSVAAVPTTFMSTKTLATTTITNSTNATTSLSGVYPVLEFSGDYRNVNVNLTVSDIVQQNNQHFPQTHITFARNTYDNRSMMLTLPAGSGTKTALICYNDSQNNNKLCIQGSSFGQNNYYYKNFLQELPAEVSAADVTGVTITVKATDDVYASYLYHRGIYVGTAGNSLYFLSNWSQTSNVDGYKTFTGTFNQGYPISSYGLSADYPFIWMQFGVSNSSSAGKDRKYWIEDITFETA